MLVVNNNRRLRANTVLFTDRVLHLTINYSCNISVKTNML